MNKKQQYRQLDEKEKKLTLKNLESSKKQKEYKLFEKEYLELMRDKGLKANYQKELLKNKEQLIQNSNDLHELEFIITVSEKQLKEGVPIKENN